jgi:hypothetical protein
MSNRRAFPKALLAFFLLMAGGLILAGRQGLHSGAGTASHGVGGSGPLTTGTRLFAGQGPLAEGVDGDCSDVVTGPATIDLLTLPKSAAIAGRTGRGGGRPELPISEVEAEMLRRDALFLEENPNIQLASAAGIKPFAPTLLTSFESLLAGDNVGGTSVPPDPEMCAGPNHLIAVVNTVFAIYDKSGTTLVGPADLDTLFAPLSGCTSLFDPNANYDEETDRFIIGADDGNAYCIAVTQTSDPTGIWNLYRIPTLVSGATLFDYPHAGVGPEGIFFGSNQFIGNSFLESRVWAVDKTDLYAGNSSPGCVSHSTGDDSTPWPADYHGLPFPSTGKQYFMTEVYDGALHTVWEWSDPFGADTFVRAGDVDLNAATGVTAGFPIDAPQSGGGLLQANDWRGQSTFYRNGNLWMSNQGIACNPGGGTVDCVRWAEIDPDGGGPSTPAVVQAGVFASPGEYRTFPSLAVDACDNMAIGYSKTSTSIFPGTYVTGRLASDTPGTLQAEATLKAGETNYSAFDGSPYRWGDYTGMTIDPDGETFWYLGEYSESASGTGSADWGNFIGSFTFGGCDTVFADGFESGDLSAWSQMVP